MGKNKAVMAGALVLAGAAYWAGLITGERSAAGGETGTVLVARADLPAGTVLSEDLVETRELPRGCMQADAYLVRSMSDVKMVSGMTARVRIPKGNQVTQSCLAPAAPAAGAALPTAQRHYLDGLKYFQNADYERARDEWRAALKLDPANAEAAAGLRRLRQVLSGGK